MGELFSPEGHVMHALSDLATLVFLNILTIICSIPIVTAGAAYVSLHYCVMKVADEEANVLRTYLKQFKANLKDITPLWIITLFFIGFIVFDYWIVFSQVENIKNILLIFITIFAGICLAIFVWVFPISARFTYSVGAAIRNACILAIAKFPKTIIMMVITLAIPILLFMNPRLYPVIMFLGISLPAYLCQFFYAPIIKEMIERVSEKS